ncbi:uncharacterized protein LOC117303029 [Asterias rubens]|uniref:uncharacterized protein LOC117303029 n=1 Tax=Asterias rubens TaxID=7604 RepID=UPI000FECDAAE|nr:uncharacterized protein LOC117303029 [Asterias rubens]
MKVQILFICCITSILITMVSCNDGGFNIHGGYYEVYTYSSHTGKGDELVSTKYKWGESSANGNNRKVIAGTEGICFQTYDRYCKLKLVVSAKNVPNEEHYQIKGAKIDIKDYDMTYDTDKAGFGIQQEYNGVQKIMVAEGQIWSGSLKTWGYGYLSLYVNKTTRPSTADAFLVERRESGNSKFSEETIEIGQRDLKSKEQFISTFRTWTNKWTTDSVTWWIMYIALTKVVKNDVIYAEKEEHVVAKNLISSLTLENSGSKVTSNSFAKIGSTESITLETSTSMETTFDFSIDVGSSVSLEVGFVAASVEVNLHAGHSSTEASSSTTSKTTQTSIQWPSDCPSGMKITISLYKNTKKQSVPIEFTFERNGVQWKERKIFESTANDITQTSEDCCLVATASDLCGKSIKMC